MRIALLPGLKTRLKLQPIQPRTSGHLQRMQEDRIMLSTQLRQARNGQKVMLKQDQQLNLKMHGKHGIR